MELQVLNQADASVARSVGMKDTVFGREYNESLVHQVVVSYLAGGRQGTRGQKTRSEVSGGGAKPFKQKGSGRARAGTTRGPLWRKGGVTFAAKTQDHSQKVNRTMYRSAISCILSKLVQENRLVILDQFNLETHKTKDLIANLKLLNLEEVMIVTHELSATLYLAARNLHHVDVRLPNELDPVSLIGYDKVLFTLEALKHVEEVLS